jgi:hypothetical protein
MRTAQGGLCAVRLVFVVSSRADALYFRVECPRRSRFVATPRGKILGQCERCTRRHGAVALAATVRCWNRNVPEHSGSSPRRLS